MLRVARTGAVLGLSIVASGWRKSVAVDQALYRVVLPGRQDQDELAPAVVAQDVGVDSLESKPPPLMSWLDRK